MLLRIFTFAFVFLFHTCAAYKLDNPHFLGRNALTEPFNLFKDAPVHTSPLIRDDHQLLKRSRFRAFLDISDLNAPATNMDAEDSEIIRDAFAVARSLGIAMLRLQQNDPRYQAAFGDLDGEMYNIVMQNVRRVVNILGDATAEELGSAPTADDNVAEEMIIFRVPIPDEGHQLRDSIAFTVRNTINFMADFFDPNGLFASPLPLAPTPAQREDQAYINRIAQYNRGVIVFHELVHFVTRQRMQQVVDMARAAGAVINFDARQQDVTDMPLNGIQAPENTPERDGDEGILFGIDQTARAYDTNLIARMALLTHGRFMATLNAETYAQTAISALLNIPATVFLPRIPGNTLPPVNNHQVSVYTVHIEEDHSAITAALRQRPNRSFLAMLFGQESILPDSFTKSFDL